MWINGLKLGQAVCLHDSIQPPVCFQAFSVFERYVTARKRANIFRHFAVILSYLNRFFFLHYPLEFQD